MTSAPRTPDGMVGAPEDTAAVNNSGAVSYVPDGMTLLEVLRRLEGAGYTGQLAVGSGGTVRCFTCRVESPASAVPVDRICRTEGPSDPDDMVAVVAIRCPNCAAKGTLTLKYGPGSTPDEAEVLSLLDDSDRRKGQSTDDAA